LADLARLRLCTRSRSTNACSRQLRH
jgi:hypothetical protein